MVFHKRGFSYKSQALLSFVILFLLLGFGKTAKAEKVDILDFLPPTLFASDTTIKVPFGESGTFSIGPDSSPEFETVYFKYSYNNPVLILSPVSFNDLSPAFLRVKNLNSTGFQVLLQEFDFQEDYKHEKEDIYYVVVEAGDYELDNDIKISAGISQNIGTSLSKVSFPSPYQEAPLVFTQTISFNDPQPIMCRLDSVTDQEFQIRIQEENFSNLIHVPEDVAWIAIEKKSGDGDFLIEAGDLNEAVGNNFKWLSFDHNFDDPPAIFVQAQDVSDESPYSVRYRNNTTDSVELVIQKDLNKNSDFKVPNEDVSIWYINKNFNLPTMEVGKFDLDTSDPFANQAILFKNTYTKPIVIISPASYNDRPPVMPRVFSVNPNGFHVFMQEWNEVNDDVHGKETFFYMAVEEGVVNLFEGFNVLSGKTSVNDSVVQKVKFPVPFGKKPSVFTQVSSYLEADPLVPMVDSVSTTGFNLYLKEERQLDGSHVNETVAWIAVEPVVSSTKGSEYQVEEIKDPIFNAFRPINFKRKFEEEPAIFIANQTARNDIPVIYRYDALDSSKVNVRIQLNSSPEKADPPQKENLSYLAVDSDFLFQKEVVISDSNKNDCADVGLILWEVWNNVAGDSISNIPLETSSDTFAYLNSFSAPKNIFDNYGTRMSGFICPPATGTYTFWVSANGKAELWLSTNEEIANRQRIASVRDETDPNQWNKFPEQKSADVYLEKGRTYYIEALMKETTDEDHLSVGWKLPGGQLERPILGKSLVPFLGRRDQKSNCGEKNLADGRLVRSSSFLNNKTTPDLINDTKNNTKWQSAIGGIQWIYVDLGYVLDICRVQINWGKAFATSFQLQVSNDAKNWSNVKTTINNNSEINNLEGLNTRARYVRVLATKPKLSSGYEIIEMEVYGNDKQSDYFTFVDPGYNPTELVDGLFVNIYPIPFDNRINVFVSNTSAKEAEIYIYNMSGLIMRQAKFDITNTSEKINLVGLPKGIYTAKIIAGNEQKTIRMVNE